MSTTADRVRQAQAIRGLQGDLADARTRVRGIIDQDPEAKSAAIDFAREARQRWEHHDDYAPGWVRSKVYDPDRYFADVVARYVREPPLLADDAARLRLAWAVLLATDNSRNTLQEILQLSRAMETEVAGRKAKNDRLLTAVGGSPIRGWLIQMQWSDKFVSQDTLDRFGLLHGRHRMAEINEVAKERSSRMRANFDANVLPIALELIEVLAEVGAGAKEEVTGAIEETSSDEHGAGETEGKDAGILRSIVGDGKTRMRREVFLRILSECPDGKRVKAHTIVTDERYQDFCTKGAKVAARRGVLGRDRNAMDSYVEGGRGKGGYALKPSMRELVEGLLSESVERK